MIFDFIHQPVNIVHLGLVGRKLLPDDLLRNSDRQFGDLLADVPQGALLFGFDLGPGFPEQLFRLVGGFLLGLGDDFRPRARRFLEDAGLFQFGLVDELLLFPGEVLHPDFGFTRGWVQGFESSGESNLLGEQMSPGHGEVKA